MTPAERKAYVLHEIVRRFGKRETIEPELFKEFVDAQNDGASSGLEVGALVPPLNLPDQEGRERSLRDLSGPAGLLLVFSRSADW